jgi:hypothetical protein
LALGLVARPTLAVPGDKLVENLETYLTLAGYTIHLSHLFELECPDIGSLEFTCTGHRVTVVAEPRRDL